jgi:ssDNA-binding Zn-finger/Zn-ribbon topoisomerase 1
MSSLSRNSSSTIKCYCGEPAPIVITRTNAKGNRGKKFYGCANYPGEKDCEFFKWVDQRKHQMSNTMSNEIEEELKKVIEVQIGIRQDLKVLKKKHQDLENEYRDMKWKNKMCLIMLFVLIIYKFLM